MPNITLEAANIWKKIQKQPLTKQIYIVKIKKDDTNVSTPFQVFIQSMSGIKAFKPVLIISSLANPTLL